jgi:hypothetical protein
MGQRGPVPKPAHLRQRSNYKPGASILELSDGRRRVPPLPDRRDWHPLTKASWRHAWQSPMAAHWLETDRDALGRLAIIWDAFYRDPTPRLLGAIRQQESRFGISVLDRSRLSWEVRRAEEPARKPSPKRAATADPRQLLAVK